MRKVVFILGVDDTNTARVVQIKPSGTVYGIKGTQDIRKKIRLDDFARHSVALGGERPGQFSIPQPNIFYNCICNPDSNRRSLLAARHLLKDQDVPVINHPDDIAATTRERIYELFRDTPGLIVPKTLRIAPTRLADIQALIDDGAIELPFIMRPTGGHGGEGVYLLEDAGDIHSLERYAFDGSEYYLIEFADFRDEDGLYRKYRLVMVDGRLYGRHLIICDRWNIHAASRQILMADDEALVNEEKEFLRQFNTEIPAWIADALGRVYEELGLGYFGIDCSIRPGEQLLIFEMNACINALEQPDIKDYPYLGVQIDKIKKALAAMITTRAT